MNAERESADGELAEVLRELRAASIELAICKVRGFTPEAAADLRADIEELSRRAAALEQRNWLRSLTDEELSTAELGARRLADEKRSEAAALPEDSTGRAAATGESMGHRTRAQSFAREGRRRRRARLAAASAPNRRERDGQKQANRLLEAWMRDEALFGATDTILGEAAGIPRTSVKDVLIRCLAGDHGADHQEKAEKHVDRSKPRRPSQRRRNGKALLRTPRD